MKTKIRKCPECYGEGQTACECCGSDCNCEACDGTGFDPEQIDIRKLRASQRKLKVSWAVLVDGVKIGFTNGKNTVFLKDFLLEAQSEA